MNAASSCVLLNQDPDRPREDEEEEEEACDDVKSARSLVMRVNNKRTRVVRIHTHVEFGESFLLHSTCTQEQQLRSGGGAVSGWRRAKKPSAAS